MVPTGRSARANKREQRELILQAKTLVEERNASPSDSGLSLIVYRLFSLASLLSSLSSLAVLERQ